ncbi:MAG TPA: hypothetical protein PK514_13170 [Spirochaetota bacterium]|nr:hypothetical protein [Spirochaetota bacterium]
MSRTGFTGEQRGRASELIRFIFSLPEFCSEPPLFSEHSIEKFISGLGAGYADLFRYNGWFEDMEPASIDRLLLGMLHSVTNEKVLPVIRGFIEEADFTLFDEFSGGSVPDEFRREKLYGFAETLLKLRTTRLRLNSAYTVIRYGIAERYLGEIMRKFPLVYESVASVNSRKLSPDESSLFFKTALILVNCRYLPDGQGYPASFPDIATECPRSINPDDYPEQNPPLAGDFIDILDMRFRNAGYYELPVKGCMSADASWFDTVRKPGIAGVNRQLAGIFYEIALERNW